METVKEILVRARNLKRTNWLQAERILKQGLKEYPASEELYLELSELYFQKKYYRRAINICQNALLHSRNDIFINRIGNCFLSLKEYHISLNYFEKIENVTPEQLYNKAVALAKLNRIDEALEAAFEVLEFHVKSPVPYILLGELYFNKKEFSRTVHYLDQAQKISGLSGDICFLRGMAWMGQKNLLKAYWDFHQGEVFKIQNPDYYRSYGIVCEGIGKLGKAIDLLRRAIELAPTRPGAYLELLRIYLMNSMLKAASDLMDQAREALPGDFPLTMMYNQIIDKLVDNQQ